MMFAFDESSRLDLRFNLFRLKNWCWLSAMGVSEVRILQLIKRISFDASVGYSDVGP